MRLLKTGLAVLCGLALTATGLWAGGAEEEEPAAAEEEVASVMEELTLTKLDGTTVTVEVKPAQYGGSLAVRQGWDKNPDHIDPSRTRDSDRAA